MPDIIDIFLKVFLSSFVSSHTCAVIDNFLDFFLILNTKLLDQGLQFFRFLLVFDSEVVNDVFLLLQHHWGDLESTLFKLEIWESLNEAIGFDLGETYICVDFTGIFCCKFIAQDLKFGV
jgi:hypothetical protein